MKQKKQLINEPYLNKEQIKRLLGVPYKIADKIYKCADIEDNKLEYRVEEKKVRTSSVLKVSGIKREELEKTIKGELKNEK